eukprot:scaffold12118_cov138-Cylindrotheca_fusiformis.AAC.13
MSEGNPDPVDSDDEVVTLSIDEVDDRYNHNLDVKNDKEDDIVDEDVAYSVTRNWKKRVADWGTHVETIEDWLTNNNNISNATIPSIEASKLRFQQEHPTFQEILELQRQLTEYKALHGGGDSTSATEVHLIQDGIPNLEREISNLEREISNLENEMQGLENEVQGLENEVQGLENEKQALENEMQELQSAPEGSFLRKLKDATRASTQQSIKDKRSNIEAKRSNIEAKRSNIEATQRSIEATQRSIEATQRSIKATQRSIKATQRSIKATTESIVEKLENVYNQHVSVRYQLDVVKERGNENPSIVSTRSTENSCERIDASKVSSPSKMPSKVNPVPDSSLEEELARLVSDDKLKVITELQEFVASIVTNAPAYKEDLKCATHLGYTVERIEKWQPGDVINEDEYQQLVRPSFIKPKENDVDQPILRAILLRIIEIVDLSLSVGNEQFVPTVGKEEGQVPGTTGRRVDLELHETREHLSSLFPAMLGRVIEIKAVSNNESTLLKRLGQAESQVIGHLGKQAWFSFDIGGVGEDCVLYGISLSLWSVSVSKLELRAVGTTKVSVDTKRTRRLRLLGNDYTLPSPVQDLLENGEHNALAVLAGALIVAFNKPGEEALMKQEQEQEPEQKPMLVEVLSGRDGRRLEYDRLLGSGAFSNVLRLAEGGQFLKIPKAAAIIGSIEREAKVLSKIRSDERVDIPQLVNENGSSLSKLKFFNHHEEGSFTGLKLKGIVGKTLLAEALSNKNGTDPEKLGKLVGIVHDVLRHAHDQGYVHLDIRPQNIIVTSNLDHVMVSDWGAAWDGNEEKAIRFRGCLPYAHDNWFVVDSKNSKPSAKKQKPTPDFDFASLFYTWFHIACAKESPKLPWNDEFQRIGEVIKGTAVGNRRKVCEDALGGGETYRKFIPNDILEKMIKAAGLNVVCAESGDQEAQAEDKENGNTSRKRPSGGIQQQQNGAENDQSDENTKQRKTGS